MNYFFHPAAEAEFLESVGYYESKVPGLGGALIEEFEALAKLIGESPEAWQVRLEPDIRRAPLHRFPLSIIYRKKLDAFQVLAVAHDRRRPHYWLGRL
jgi:plasmid stabilization system protein ParE